MANSEPPPKPGRPLAVQLSAIIAALVVVGLCLAGTALTVALRIKMTDEVDRQLTSTLATLSRPGQLDAAISGPSDYVLMFFADDGDLLITLMGRGGERRSPPDLDSLTPAEVAEHENAAFTVASVEGGQTWRVVAARLATSDPVTSPGSSVVLALPFDSVRATTRAMGLTVIWMALAAAVVATMAGFGLVRRSLRSLENVERAAAQIAGGDLTTRIPPARPGTEVGRLTDSLNAMLSQIEAAFAARTASEAKMRSFVSDASHELRTPLAAIRGYAELYRLGGLESPEALAGAMKRVEDEAARMGLLVSDLLTLARVDEPESLTRAAVDLVALAEDAVADAQALDPSRRVSLVRDSAPPPTVWADEAALRRVLSNLVANAVRHTPAGTPIEV
ncbi:MAG: HAMP domain-containing histidine kinase, partial [Bifidobacteriaceae bacterium]|nr:HAMP domain-containing histidine kinase [Bifidobacteriaceae bacterium]